MGKCYFFIGRMCFCAAFARSVERKELGTCACTRASVICDEQHIICKPGLLLDDNITEIKSTFIHGRVKTLRNVSNAESNPIQIISTDNHCIFAGSTVHRSSVDKCDHIANIKFELQCCISVEISTLNLRWVTKHISYHVVQSAFLSVTCDYGTSIYHIIFNFINHRGVCLRF